MTIRSEGRRFKGPVRLDLKGYFHPPAGIPPRREHWLIMTKGWSKKKGAGPRSVRYPYLANTNRHRLVDRKENMKYAWLLIILGLLAGWYTGILPLPL